MSSRYGMLNQMSELFRLQAQQISRYRFVTRHVRGCELEWEHATHEWLNQRFDTWKRNLWQEAVAEALRLPAYVLN